MKKGIERRDQIIEAAERLFYEKGYEQTSVQDVLDALSLSKGGFYHYFQSKIELLEAVCRRQSVRDAEEMTAAVARQEGAVAKLNTLLRYCGLLRADRMDFALLVLRVGYLGGSLQLRACLREGLMETALPMMREIILEGMAENVFFTRFPDDIGELILQLFANITDELAMLIASGAPENQMGDMLTRLETYRCSVETLLGAPFGTITLCDLRLIPEAAAAMAAKG
ncbi:MAG: helix-turn-helix domain containing protein [Clostridiales bacterium]|nr:TetR/AcrR family transcriptional regulator [Clostridiales bacterium]MDD6872518.1 helix-turn-helix domain containing protein [Clostridiales bacterium]